MPLSTESQADDEQYILVASLDNVRNLSNILKAISFKEHAIFTATPNGLKVTVEDSKCLQANAFIQVCLCHEPVTNAHTFSQSKRRGTTWGYHVPSHTIDIKGALMEQNSLVLNK